MTRFVASTCGVLAEVAALDATAPAWMLAVAAGGFLVAVILWWSDVRGVIDHLVGLDL